MKDDEIFALALLLNVLKSRTEQLEIVKRNIQKK
jgi:hypothetical protein